MTQLEQKILKMREMLDHLKPEGFAYLRGLEDALSLIREETSKADK